MRLVCLFLVCFLFVFCVGRYVLFFRFVCLFCHSFYSFTHSFITIYLYIYSFVCFLLSVFSSSFFVLPIYYLFIYLIIYLFIYFILFYFILFYFIYSVKHFSYLPKSQALGISK